MLIKKQPIPVSSNYSSFPETILSPIARTVAISVTGSGLIKGTTGRRWWDSSVLADSGNISLLANTPIILPFTKSFMFSGNNDFIARVAIDGQSIYYSSSSSPDNIVTSSPAIDANICWLDLLCFGTSGNGGLSSSNNNFMQGAAPSAMTTTLSTIPAKFNFAEPTGSAGSLQLRVGYSGYSTSAPVAPYIADYPFTSGATIVNTVTPAQLQTYFNSLGYSFLLPANTGFFTIQAIISGTSGSMVYQQLLNRYHWGLSG